MLHRDPASFRDPDGFVFSLDGSFYRSVTPAARALLINGGAFFSAAVEQGLLLPFEIDAEIPASAGTDVGPVIKPEIIELITYPHEWCFEQLKSAALNTLDINILALEHRLTLKDASAFNTQTHHGDTVFIDHTSFEPSDGKLPWRPYSQFCRHFLNPLVMSSYRDIHAGSFFRMNLDGIPQQTANDYLPWRACLVPSIAMHMLLHNRFIRRSSDFEAKNVQAKDVSPRGNQLDLLKQLRAFIGSLTPARAGSTWANYYANTNYDDATFAMKKELVAATFEGRQLGTVWDIGANDGTFSRLVAGSADRVLALDLDHNAVNACYVRSRIEGQREIHPLVYDVCNPTPSLGFENTERSTLEHRSKPDAMLALAVIHHLSITNNIPLDQSANYFAARANELLIEFVGPADSQVKRLLAQKSTSYNWYNEQNFQAAFSKRFRVKSRKEIPGTDRSIYHMVRTK
jgi:hypothetical protein